MHEKPEQQWSERLEAGAEDDELLALAAQLRQAGESTRPEPSLAFQRQLRHDLLEQYDRVLDRRANVWRWAGSLAAMALLAIAVTVTWLSISSSGRPSFGGQPAPAIEATGVLPTTAVEAVAGELPLPGEVAQLSASALNAPRGLIAGGALEVITRWRIPEGTTARSAYAHLLDSAGQLIAQADGTLAAEGPLWLATLILTLPDPLPPGDYSVVAGLSDESGAPLPVFDTEVGSRVELGPLTVAPVSPAAPALTVLDVSPATDADLSGTAPITFTVRLAYEGVSPPAVLEVKIEEGQGDRGRGVAAAQVTLAEAAGEVTVPVVLRPMQELNGPAELGLWLQIHADNSAPPELIEISDAYRWHYTP